MPEYRYNRVPGGTFFLTLNLRDRCSNLLVAHVDVLRETVHGTCLRSPFRIAAWVVLPDHMHCSVDPGLRRGRPLPPGDADFPGRWRASKIAFAKSLLKGEPRSPVMTRRGEHGIWQRRYWEHTIRDERDFAVHMDCTHFNPAPARPFPAIPGSNPGRGGLGRGSTRRAGRTRRSAGVSRLASIPPDGQAAAPSRKRPASGGENRKRVSTAQNLKRRRNALRCSALLLLPAFGQFDRPVANP